MFDGLSCVFSALEDWQTLVAGLVGFGGLAFTVYKSAELTRRRDSELSKAEAKSFAVLVSWNLYYRLLQVATFRKHLNLIIEDIDNGAEFQFRERLEVARKTIAGNNLPGLLSGNADKAALLPGEVIASVSRFFCELSDLREEEWDISKTELYP